jgi:hypothetical protein
MWFTAIFSNTLVLQLIAIIPITIILLPTLLSSDSATTNENYHASDSDSDEVVVADRWIPFATGFRSACYRLTCGGCCGRVSISRRSRRILDADKERNHKMPPPHRMSTAQILSDVDDTFICSGAGWVGGTDKRFHSHVVYPGAPSFYLALSRGEQDAKRVEGVIWMSARAAHTPIINLFGGEIDNSHPIGRALVMEGRRQGISGFGTKGGLYGKFRHNIRFSRDSRNALKGEHKFHNFVEYMRMTPFIKKTSKSAMNSLAPPSAMSRTTSGIALEEMIRNDRSRAKRFFSCDVCECQVDGSSTNLEQPTGPYIFLGDNGEGDEVTAIRLLMAHPDRVRACFIHDVTGRGYGRNQHARNLVQKRKLFYFKTYLGAALHAFEVGLISKYSVNRIREAILQSPHTQIARRETAGTESDLLSDFPSSSSAGETTGEIRRRASPPPPLYVDDEYINNSNESEEKKKDELVRPNFALWCSQVRQDMAAYDALMTQGKSSESNDRSRRRLHSDPLLPLISPTFLRD